jgi:flagellin FlaB
MHRFLGMIKRGQKGITGLETAIILIAFVVVASVFAYTVLSSGLFATQKAKEAIHAGLQEAKSTVELKGNVLGKMEKGILTTIYFTVGTPPGGDSIDFTPPSANTTSLVIISYSDAYQVIPSLNWTMAKLNTTAADNLLEGNRLFQITVDLSAVSANVSDEKKPGPYHTFQLELKPPVGAILNIERTIPNKADEVINLY